LASDGCLGGSQSAIFWIKSKREDTWTLLPMAGICWPLVSFFLRLNICRLCVHKANFGRAIDRLSYMNLELKKKRALSIDGESEWYGHIWPMLLAPTYHMIWLQCCAQKNSAQLLILLAALLSQQTASIKPIQLFHG
jgi:hypothetical protein